MRVILLGPPGAGKGTQVSKLTVAINTPSVSSGDLFRQHQKDQTNIGIQAQNYMKRGLLVPDDLTIKMVMEWIDSYTNSDGFLLDGFPRTYPQAVALDEALRQNNEGIDRVLNLKVGIDELINRLSGRIICRNCQRSYHLTYAPPISPGVCNECEGELYEREDDNRDAVQKRLEVYFDETEPLINYYSQKGLLTEISGTGSIEVVAASILDGLVNSTSK